jgi:crotonobetainyl-CoA:carnitine CoA-transferase CaiB-like acyl-CoA transferase
VSLLAGLRVLAVEQYGAGPFASLHLGDLGAEVIKIEPPGVGDYGRGVPPYTSDKGDDSLFFQSLNRNKASVTLDLAHPRGRQIFGDLVRESDAVLTNLRSGAQSRLGLTYSDLRDHNPSVVCCSLTGFGSSGSRADAPGFDYLVQAESGIMNLAGEPGGAPVKAGVSIIDFASGIAAGFALLAGVLSARASGQGRDVEVSLQDTASSLLNYVATWYLTEGYEVGRVSRSGHPSLVPSQLFDCLDAPIVVMVNKESFWAPLTQALGHPEWATAPDRATFADRFTHRAKVVQDLGDVFAGDTAEHWLARLAAHGVPSGPVRTVAEAFETSEYADRTVTFRHPFFGEVRSPGPLVRSDARSQPPSPGPALGSDTDLVLTTLAGVDPTELPDLRASGVI